MSLTTLKRALVQRADSRVKSATWRKVVLTAAGVSATALVASACQPAPGINYNQWRYPETVKNISTICPFAPPFTYPGHDPQASLAADFMVPGGGHTQFGINCGNTIKDWAVGLALQGTWHVHYVAFQQKIWNVDRVQDGWRMMANRGSWTQNHMDHVHVSMR